jgi:hypothetical protein
MSVSCDRNSVSSEPTIQNARRPRRVARPALFCAIAVAVSIVPFSGASGQNGVAVIGPSASSTPYGCTTAGTSGNIQQAIADAVNHTNGITQSVVDASNCTTLSITSQIYVGATPGNVNQRIKFIVPANGTWTATFSDTTKYALMWGNGAMIYGGTGSGEGQPFAITSASGTSLKAICGNDPNPANSQGYPGVYFHAEGFSCAVGAGSTVSDAVIEIANNADESYLGHVTAGIGTSQNATGSAPRVLWSWGACCSATIEDINAEAGTLSTPCVFGNGPSPDVGIHVSKLSCIHPGNGDNAMLILQNGVGMPSSSFRDIFIEYAIPGPGTGYTDSSTPSIDVQGSTSSPAAADLLDGIHFGPDASTATRCAVNLGTASRANISNLSLRSTGNSTAICAINDASGVGGTSSVLIAGAPGSVITSYDMGPRYLGAMTVSMLPTASANNAGAMFRVTDSATTVEGGTCQSGGSQTALAFSNGTVWKCF